MNQRPPDGQLFVNDIEVRYMTASSLLLDESPINFIDNFNLLPMVHRLSFNELGQLDPMNIGLSGPKGQGKSLMWAYWAQKNCIPYLSIDCSDEIRDRQLKGGFIGKKGETPFVLGTVANAIQVANEYGAAMLVFEELTALTQQRQKELNPLTDFRKKIEIPELSWRLALEPGKVLFVVCTMNPSSYGGTYSLNEDLRSRFTWIEVPYPPPAAEKAILREAAPPSLQVTDEHLTQIVNIANETRQGETSYALSTRDLIQVLQVAGRLGWQDAFFVMSQKFDEDDRRLVIDRIRDTTMLEVYPSVAHRAGLIVQPR